MRRKDAAKKLREFYFSMEVLAAFMQDVQSATIKRNSIGLRYASLETILNCK